MRAEELAAEAEELYADLRLDVEAGGAVDETLWRFLDTTIRLGQLHASLVQRPVGTSADPTVGPVSMAG